MRKNRETPRPPDQLIRGGTLREGQWPEPEMHGRGESDRSVLPAKAPNNAGQPAAEASEEGARVKGNTDSETRTGLGAGQGVSSGLDRVRHVARKDKEARFTALLHHVDVARLETADRAIRPQAAAGGDGVTWQDYGQDLEANLRDLHRRVHSGADPSETVSGGCTSPRRTAGSWPLGIAALEDKIVQRAVVEVLNAIYEEDFVVGFSDRVPDRGASPTMRWMRAPESCGRR